MIKNAFYVDLWASLTHDDGNHSNFSSSTTIHRCILWIHVIRIQHSDISTMVMVMSMVMIVVTMSVITIVVAMMTMMRDMMMMGCSISSIISSTTSSVTSTAVSSTPITCASIGNFDIILRVRSRNWRWLLIWLVLCLLCIHNATQDILSCFACRSWDPNGNQKSKDIKNLHFGLTLLPCQQRKRTNLYSFCDSRFPGI